MIMFVAMLAVLTCQLRPSSAEKVHWVYLPNPPSFQPVDWMNEPIRIFVTDTHLLGRSSITDLELDMNLPANAGNWGSIPGEESKIPHALACSD